MRIKDRFTLKIESIAFGGAGVGRVDDFVVFTPFTAPGDVVEVEIVQCKKKFARGRLVKIAEPSPQRTAPLCRYYGRCGGCSYQHIDYAHQLQIKQKQVEDAFLRIGGVSRPEVRRIIGSPGVYAYRGKARLHAAKTTRGCRLGFIDISGGKITDIERCEIMDETINEQIMRMRMKEKVLFSDDELTFWSGVPDHSTGEIIRVVKGREFLVPREGFFQANLHLTDRMVDTVCSLVGSKKRATIIDACCGSGLFSIFLAPYAGRTIGVEINENSVRCARLNAERQGVQNTGFIYGDIEDVLSGMAEEMVPVEMIILDPPRAGLSPETLTAISGLKSQDIIYISCNPATQARDIKFLSGHGYSVQCLQPLDMFPQTEHIENIALLRRR
jgi:tRNA/tmRNA/rRNA uracil-C5-methylase (TrmA/RlmC/RlmD family)